jgi:hypothetical protein
MDEQTGPSGSSQALRRIVRQARGTELLDALASGLPGTDLTTLLLEVFRRRAGQLRAADILQRYGADRFVTPAAVSFAALRRAEDAMLAALPGGFDVLALAPVLPLGAHSAVAAVDPRNVLATIRGSEVAADPTNGLALEAAVRRRGLMEQAPRSAELVRLAATQRVLRTQQVSGPVSFAHFQLLGVITAGRDTGSHTFERGQAVEHLRFGVAALSVLGADRIRIELTCMDELSARVLAAIREDLVEVADAEVTEAPGRQSGRGYYHCMCFKIFATFGAAQLEVADGGFVDWTQQLLGNRKERLLISGYGIDRIAVASQPG